MKKIKSAVWVSVMSSVFATGCGKDMTAQEYLRSAISYYEGEDYGRARVQFRNALREDNGLAEAYYYLSLISEAKGDTYLAYADIQRAVQLAPDNEKIRLKIAEYYVLTGQFDKAIEHVGSLADANSVAACKVKAASLIGKRSYQEALTAGQACQSDDPELGALRVIALKFAGELVAATREVNALIAVEPNVPSYRLMALELAQLRGDFDATVSILKELMKLSPSDERPALTLASELSKGGDEQQAFDVLVTFNHENPKNTLVKRVLLEVAEQKGLANLNDLLDEFLVQLPNDAGLQLLQVSQLLKGGRADEAKRLLMQIVDGEPGDIEAYVGAQLLLARLFALENNWQESISRATSLLSKSPYHKDALLLAGTAALNLRDAQNALGFADKLLAREPDNAGAMHIKARAHGLLGEIAEQKLWYEKIILKDPESLVARDFLVGDSIKQRRVAMARRLLGAWPKKQRESGEYAMRILQLEMAEGNWPRAREALKQLSSGASLGWREQLFEAQILAGEGRQDAAIDAYKAVIEAQPAYVAAYDQLASIVDESSLGAVSSWLAEIIATDSKNIPAVVLQAHFFERSANASRAMNLLDSALSQSPEWLQGYKLLSQVHQRQGEIQAAIAVYNRGLKVVPDDAFLVAGKAALLESAADYAGAAALYEMLLKKQPNSHAVKNNYALLLVSYPDFRTDARVKRAQAMVTEFAALKSPVLQDTYGWVLYHAGDFRGAENVLKLASEKMPNNPEIMFHLASALVAQEDPSKTKAAKVLVERAKGAANDSRLLSGLAALEDKISK